MTKLRRALLLLALAAVAAACAQTATGHAPRVAVVVAGPAAGDSAVVERAAAAAHDVGAPLRVPRSPTEQLAVTHLLAVEGYDAVIGVGLDRRVAIAPVARRFPHVRFIAARPASLAAALRYR